MAAPDVKIAASQILTRAFVLLVLFGIGAVVAYSSRRQFHPYHIGSRAIAYDQRAAQVLDLREHITVISAALEDGRGIVALPCSGGAGTGCIPNALLGPKEPASNPLPACDTQAVIADAWDALLVFCVQRTRPVKSSDLDASTRTRMAAWITERPPGTDVLTTTERRAFLPKSRTEMCPDSECAPVDHGGLASTGQSLLLVESHSQRLTEFVFGDSASAGGQRVIYSGSENARVHDVTVGGGRFLLSTSQVSQSSIGSTVAMLQSGPTDAVAKTIETRALAGLGLPVGIAYSATPEHTRVYVADLLGDVLRWSYRDQVGGQFGPQRTFWTTKVGARAPALQHMVTAVVPGVGEVVFAGAPDGLYLFQPDDGTLLAKYVLNRPVQGLAWGRTGELFMTAGRYLCVLRTRPVLSAAAITTTVTSPVPSSNETRATSPSPNSANPAPQAELRGEPDSREPAPRRSNSADRGGKRLETPPPPPPRQDSPEFATASPLRSDAATRPAPKPSTGQPISGPRGKAKRAPTCPCGRRSANEREPIRE